MSLTVWWVDEVDLLSTKKQAASMQCGKTVQPVLRLDEVCALLESWCGKPQEMQAIMRKHGLVLDDLDDRMQKLAFTFYTELCVMDKTLTDLLAQLKGAGDE